MPMFIKNRMLSVRSMGLLVGLLIVIALFLSARASAELELIAMDGKKIVTGSSVRIRTLPSLESEIMGRVELGAVVTATRRTKDKLETGELNHYWYNITIGENNGWVSGSLLRDFKPEEKEKIWFEMIRERMDNKELSFVDRMALHKFVSLVSEKSQDEKLQAAFELGEMLALQKSFDAVNYGNSKQEPYLSWVEQYQTAGRVFLDEISGHWLVPAADFWKLADKYEERPGADEIGWYAANAQLGGECEGDISCNLTREKLTQGEYLRRNPYGRYAATSLQRLGEALSYIQEELKQQPEYFKQVNGEGAGEIEALFEIIANSNPKLTERAKAFKQIKAIRKVAKQK